MTPQSEATEQAVREGKQAKQYMAAAARPTFINTGATWQQQGWHMFHALRHDDGSYMYQTMEQNIKALCNYFAQNKSPQTTL